MLTTFPDPRWSDLAACAEYDTEFFFPPKGVSARKAKAVCASCPVVSECREFALAVPEEHGVWGNTTPEERKALRRQSRVLSVAS
jgi:WhiB family redox-sensing transcriptional regulator